MTTNQKQGSRQTKETSQKPRPAGPAGQGPVALMEAADRLLLQRAVADPALAAPADILALQGNYGNRAVQRLVLQRQGPEEEEEIQAKSDLHQVGLEGGRVPRDVESAIQRARGGGQPLEGAVQKQMSETMGYDFSGVRVHIGQEADGLNQQLQAKAFTTGADIFFRRGAYDPGSGSGRELVAHELTHVVQQGTGRVSGVSNGMVVRHADDDFEKEAQSAAANAAGRRVAAQTIRSLPSHVQLDADSPIQRGPVYEHIKPEKIVEDHPNLDLVNVGQKVTYPNPMGGAGARADILCTQAVGLAKSKASGTSVDELAQLVDLQGEVENAARTDDAEATLGKKEYRVPGKIVHWLEGGNTHKHSGVVRDDGSVAGYNQGQYVKGGKPPGFYNVGKILWPKGVTVKMTD